MNPHSPVRAASQTRPGPIKVRKLAILLAAMAASSQFAPSLAIAQSAAPASTGTIQGRVLNASNGRYVANARVIVTGTTIEAFTDDFGNFTINNVPTGVTNLTVTYVGQEPTTASLTVEAGKTTVKDISLNADRASYNEDGTLILNEFVVNSERYKNATELAINAERTSVNIKNVIAADAFGDIPSGNVGEFVKFIPGIQVSYGAYGGAGQGASDSDASGISVRGFGADDTAILIDGMPVANNTPGTMTRQIGLDMLTINNASRIEVIKVPTPDMPANSIGGQVNLITKSAFEYSRPSADVSIFLTANSENLDFKKTPGPTDESTYKIAPAATISFVYPINSKLGLSFTLAHIREFDENHKAQSTWNHSRLTAAQAGAISEEAALKATETAYANPWLSRFSVTDTPRYTTRNSGNIRADWRPFEGSTITANYQISTYSSDEGQRKLDFQPVSNNTNSTAAQQTPVAWGPDFTRGLAGTNIPRLEMTVVTRDKIGDTHTGFLKWDYLKGPWDVSAYGNLSKSTGEMQDAQNGHFSEVSGILGASGTPANQLQMTFSGINEGIPSRIDIVDNQGNGTPLDYTQLSKWRYNSDVQAKSGEAFSRDTVGVYGLDIRRDLDFLPGIPAYSLALKAGVRRDQKKNEKWGKGTGYRRSLDPTKAFQFSEIIDDDYTGQEPGFGQPAQQWLSTYKLYQLDQERQLFIETAGDAVENYNSRINQLKSITETRDAFYGLLDGKFFNNRLSAIAGARQENNKREGYGPFQDAKGNYLKDGRGVLYTDTIFPNGVRIDQTASPLYATSQAGIDLRQRLTTANIAFPTAAVTGLDLRQRTLYTRAINQKVNGKPSYSINFAYEVTKDLVAKAAYSRTFGQIALEDADDGLISGNGAYRMEDYEPAQANGVEGQIQVANPALKPWVSDNWDFALSYYNKSGGKITVSYYRKSVENFQESFTTYQGSPAWDALLPALGLDPADSQYDDWRLVTSTNGIGTQKTSGYEIEVQQDFAFLGSWGKRFATFANYAHKNLAAPSVLQPVTILAPDGTTIQITPAGKSVSKSADDFGGAGLMYADNRFTFTIRGTYREQGERNSDAITFNRTGSTSGGNTNVAATGNYLRTFDPEEIRIDLSASYKLSKRYSIFATARDVLNNERDITRKDDLGWRPTYSKYTEHKEFGVEFTLGVKGTF